MFMIVLLFILLVTFFIMFKTFHTIQSATTSLPHSLSSRKVFFSNSATSPSKNENYMVMIQDPLNLSFLIHQKCENEMSLRFTPWIENALFLMSIYPDNKVSFKSMYTTNTGQDGYISTSSTSSECSHVPSLLAKQDNDESTKWVVMDNRNPVQPQYILQWKAGDESGFLDCKLMGSEQQYMTIDNDNVNLMRGLDVVSTIRILRPNMDYAVPSNALVGIVQFNNLYLNHNSNVPALSDVPVSAIWTFYMNSIHELGFQEISFELQAHPKSDPTYFPSWYLQWDLNSGFVMTQNSNPMTTWTLDISSRVFQSDGMKIYGYLKHNGYYVCKSGGGEKNTLTTSLTKPSSSECFAMKLFNHVFL